MQTIDVHAHILTEETIRLLQREAPKVGPKLSEIGEQFATLDVAGNVYRHFPRGGWDLERRLQDMAASKVDVQVLSVCPQTFVYAQPPALAAAFARIQNEQLAKLAKARPDRFLAIATLPMHTTIAAACLVFSGVLERHPSLKICLVHGGGFVPYQAGRFVHGWHVRAEPKRKLDKPPTDSLKRFYFDTIVHSKEALAFLVGHAGADRVLLGSDYPFDMGMPEGVSQVRGLSISAAEQSAILGGRARALLGAGDKTRAFA